jgi:phospho-N-acetylmuramoyl-pentapeptide-transferase
VTAGFVPLGPSFLLALALVVAAARPGLALLRWLKTGQHIRAEGPQDHLAKAGTPSMGGIAIVAAAIVATLPFMRPDPAVLATLCVFAGFMGLGFLDDYLSLRRAANKGLSVRQKLFGQFLLGILFASALWWSGHQPWVLVPFAHYPWDLGPIYWPLLVFLVVGFTNSVNLTDGLDGLAATTVAIAMAGLAALLVRWGQPAAHPGILPFALAVSGACAGFLWLNAHPAQCFMGDTGSLALGAALVAVAAVGHLELYLLPVGILFVGEALSVMLQVGYFKATRGKRIFRMSPVHHHFELGGLRETKIVARFALVGLVAAAVTAAWL